MRMAIISRPDGGVTIKVPTKKLLARNLSDAEMDAIFQDEVSRRVFLSGASVVFVGDEASVRAKLSFADGSADAPDKRQWRRNAMTWNAGTQMVEDNFKKTTEAEMDAAADWELENAIGKPDASRSQAERRLAAGRPDLLDGAERDDIIKRWRASGQAPSVSSFVPPGDAEVPPPILRRGRA